jgi:hypothetical protein
MCVICVCVCVCVCVLCVCMCVCMCHSIVCVCVVCVYVCVYVSFYYTLQPEDGDYVSSVSGIFCDASTHSTTHVSAY